MFPPYAKICLPAEYDLTTAEGTGIFNTVQARSSGGEHYPDTVGVKGSNPFVPTRYRKKRRGPAGKLPALFSCLYIHGSVSS